MSKMIVLGDEALALGALHGGMTAAYGYPGTPSTEIIEFLLDHRAKTPFVPGSPGVRNQGIVAQWCANEKTAYEEALGTSFAGCRALVTMKHVGLNVAADPFMNSALLNLKGGLVIVVADDPSMHSSQNEQDSRYFADFARIPCFEPCDQQECYDMVRQAFDLSEELHVPVMIRLVTRLSHSRGSILVRESREQNVPAKALDKENWMLIPALARRRWHHLLSIQTEMTGKSETSVYNELSIPRGASASKAPFGVICTGLGFNYFRENQGELTQDVPFLRISQYPLPVDKIRQLAQAVETLVILEEGYPLVERLIRGILPGTQPIKGKMDGTVPEEGELTPENVRPALGLAPIAGLELQTGPLPGRPPQLCKGCPHGDSYNSIKEALKDYQDGLVSADIGCYALGVLPPYSVPETIICMGASIGVAKGASEAGYKHAVAVIGDSTFYHSGITPLIDAVSAKAAITVMILDNGTVAMTGGQETILAGHHLVPIIQGIGVDPAHIRVLEALPKNHEVNAQVIKDEIAYPGVSVIIVVRECIETLRKKNKAGAPK